MNPIDAEHVRLSGRLFDDVLAPLAAARRAAGAAPYFPAGPDPAAASYFSAARPRSMSPADFEFPGGGTAAGLVAALVTQWSDEGESVLAASGPRLIAIAEALDKARLETDGSVDIFCYTLF